MLADGDDVLAHERGTGLEVVHEGLVTELTVVATGVTQSVPGFYADEGSLLLVGTPEGDDGTAVVHCDSRRSVEVQQFGTMGLRVMDLHRVVREELVVEDYQALVDAQVGLCHLVRTVDIALQSNERLVVVQSDDAL